VCSADRPCGIHLVTHRSYGFALCVQCCLFFRVGGRVVAFFLLSVKVEVVLLVVKVELDELYFLCFKMLARCTFDTDIQNDCEKR
jgi:hypothetical protein